jgi:hypothetical protein
MQGAQKLRSEAHLRVRRNDEVEAQRRRWNFDETIILRIKKYQEMFRLAIEFSIPAGFEVKGHRRAWGNGER